MHSGAASASLPGPRDAPTRLLNAGFPIRDQEQGRAGDFKGHAGPFGAVWLGRAHIVMAEAVSGSVPYQADSDLPRRDVR